MSLLHWKEKKIILKELLTSKEPIKLEYFAKVFDLTPPTISYYLKDIEKWLEKKQYTFNFQARCRYKNKRQ